MRGEVLRGMHVEMAPVHLPAGAARPAAVVEPIAPAPVAGVAEQVATALRTLGDDARRSGYEEGLRRGEAEAEQRVATAVERAVKEALLPLAAQEQQLRHLLQRLEAIVPDALAQAEDEMVALCFETLCRIVGDSVALPDQVRACLRHLASLRREAVEVHVHPQDAELVETASEGGRVRWVRDPEVAFGGCTVHAVAGSLDLRLDTALEECKQVMREARARRGALANGRAQGGTA